MALHNNPSPQFLTFIPDHFRSRRQHNKPARQRILCHFYRDKKHILHPVTDIMDADEIVWIEDLYGPNAVIVGKADNFSLAEEKITAADKLQLANYYLLKDAWNRPSTHFTRGRFARKKML